jgi:hypothetical protein
MKLIKEAEITVDLNEDYKNDVSDNIRVDEWELEAAKRVALNLRSLLFEEKMLDLIHDQVEESDRLIKGYVAKQPDDFNYGRLKLTVNGIHSKAFFASVQHVMTAVKDSPKQIVFEQGFYAHPEHYALDQGNIETMGGRPTETLPTFVKLEDAPDFVREFIDDQYPIQSAGAGPLRDGTPFTYVLQQMKDTDAGMVADLMIWYPAGAPDIYVEEHVEHYAIEFRNGCKLAAAHQSQSK